jgi:hypothetical protein
MKYIRPIWESYNPLPGVTNLNIKEIVDEIRLRVEYDDFKFKVEDLIGMIEMDDDEDLFEIEDHLDSGRSWSIEAKTSKLRKDRTKVSSVINDNGGTTWRGTPLDTRTLSRFIEIAEVADTIRVYYDFDLKVKGSRGSRSNPKIIEYTKDMLLQLDNRCKLEDLELSYHLDKIHHGLKLISIGELIDDVKLKVRMGPDLLTFRISKTLSENPFSLKIPQLDPDLDNRFKDLADKYGITNFDRVEIIKMFKDFNGDD